MRIDQVNRVHDIHGPIALTLGIYENLQRNCPRGTDLLVSIGHLTDCDWNPKARQACFCGSDL